jgi:multiple sugar transport system substrate-binding protein
VGSKDGEVAQVYKNCFKEICLDGKPIQGVLDAQAARLNAILDEIKVACWKPDPAGTPCKVV